MDLASSEQNKELRYCKSLAARNAAWIPFPVHIHIGFGSLGNFYLFPRIGGFRSMPRKLNLFSPSPRTILYCMISAKFEKGRPLIPTRKGKPHFQSNTNKQSFLFLMLCLIVYLVIILLRRIPSSKHGMWKTKTERKTGQKKRLPRPTHLRSEMHLFNQLGVPPCNVHTPWNNNKSRPKEVRCHWIYYIALLWNFGHRKKVLEEKGRTKGRKASLIQLNGANALSNLLPWESQFLPKVMMERSRKKLLLAEKETVHGLDLVVVV